MQKNINAENAETRRKDRSMLYNGKTVSAEIRKSHFFGV